MPSHSRHSDIGAEVSKAQPCSTTSSKCALDSVQDIFDLKGVVQNIVKRLEALERTFLSVDLEQINQLLAKVSTPELPADASKADSKHDSSSIGATPSLSKKSRSKSSTRTLGSTNAVDKLSFTEMPRRGHPQDRGRATSPQGSVAMASQALSPAKTWGPPLSPRSINRLKAPSTARSLAASASSPSLSAAESHKAREGKPRKHRGSADFNKLQDRFHQFELGLTSSTMDTELKSTASTWGQTSRTAWDGDLEGDNDKIDPERLSNFVKQATRPRCRQPSQTREERLEVDELTKLILGDE